MSLHAWQGGAVVSEITQEEALQLADELVGQALKETQTRCSVLAQFIQDCDHAGSRTSSWTKVPLSPRPSLVAPRTQQIQVQVRRRRS
jgi:hypothetical protein